MEKAKTIQILLYDGTLNGVIYLENSLWNSGVMYSVPRDSVDNSDTMQEITDYYGVYLLISKDKVYIGQSSDLRGRIRQHLIGKDWWERVLVLTTKDNSLNKSDIDYLEYTLIEEAKKFNTLDSDNKKNGNAPKITKFRRTELTQYLEEALFLLELIGIGVFKEKANHPNKHKDKALIKSVPDKTHKFIEIRAKREAKSFLEENGILLEGNWSYAKLQENKGSFWINPDTSLLNDDWTIVLNNQNDNEIIVLCVPGKSLATSSNGGQLYCRKDKPNRIDLNIHKDTLIDRRSGINFSDYIVKRIKY